MRPERSIVSAAVVLPADATTRDGIRFQPNDDLWRLRGIGQAGPVKFDLFLEVCPSLVRSIKATLLWYARNRSLQYLRNIHSLLLALVVFAKGCGSWPFETVSKALLRSYRDARRENRVNLGRARAALKKWHELGYPGVDGDAYAWLHRISLPGNRKGEAVRTLDPIQGPLTDLELDSLLAALTDALRSGRMPLDDFLATMIYVLLAPRPIQLVAMKLSDLVVRVASDGTKAFLLKVPRAKQRGHRPRQESKFRHLPVQVGELIEKHVRGLLKAYEHELPDPAAGPLFPSRWAPGSSIPGLEFHQTANTLSSRLQHSLASVAPVSERTGRPLKVTSQRLRRTLGTRLRAEGHGLRYIAELLDHSDLQNVGVYSAVTPMIMGRISKKMAFSLAPIIRAFQGTPIATLAGQGIRITDPRLDTSSTRPVGCCGSGRLCDLAAPVGCYPCREFRPWLEGPHLEMLERLLRERERIRTTCDERMAAALTRTIAAVAETIQACERARADRARKPT